MSNKEFDFESFKAEAIKGMYAGKPLNGEKGIFAPLLKHFLESALEGELEAHLQEEKASGIHNRRNGKASKRVKSVAGEFNLESSRDRSGSFDPVVLPKHSSNYTPIGTKINSPGITRAALDRHSSTNQRMPSFAYANLIEKYIVKNLFL